MIYSKRHLKGLPSPKEIVVKGLADYMKLFSSDRFGGYIYRGEPTNYHDTVSSALRGGEYPFIQMKNDYKREIFHRLTPDERKDFWHSPSIMDYRLILLILHDPLWSHFFSLASRFQVMMIGMIRNEVLSTF